jgi:hypothetical protein
VGISKYGRETNEPADYSAYHCCHLIDLLLDTPVYMTNAYRDLSYSGNAYLRLGHLLSIGKITEDANMTASTVSINLSGVDQSFISAFLSNPIANKIVNIYFAYLNNDGTFYNNSPNSNPVKLYSGYIDTFSISETPDTKSTITLKTANHWSAFTRKSGRRINDDDQQHFFPGDRGFQFAAETIDNLQWGREDA